MTGVRTIDLDDLGPVRRAAEEAIERLVDGDVVDRIWARDHTVWQPDPEEIENRLGWLDAPAAPPEPVDAAARLLAEAREEGMDRSLLLGMGGSSLAPEVFARVFGPTAEGLDLRILDSTDPAAVRALLDWADPRRTLVVVSSKSGTTVETLSLFRAFWTRAVEELGAETGSRFAAVTDPGTPLEDTATRLGFRRAFRGDPEVGGRYSALTWFGLAPADLIGVDVDRLLERARSAAEACLASDPVENPGASLGAVLGGAAAAGRDKLTLVLSPAIEPFGAWIEQLIAESTGKEGRGILPLRETRPAAPEAYGEDRLFVHLRLEGDTRHDDGMAALERTGHPVVHRDLAGRYDLGREIFAWEFATAVAGHLLGIHPFDQPNVEAAKRRAGERIEAFREAGSLDEPEPDARDGDLAIWAGFPADGLEAAIEGLAARTVADGYVAVQAFLPPTAEIETGLERLTESLRARTGLAVTAAYGPRYLHSTGQLHKGDAGDGVFLMLTAPATADVPIPDQPGSDSASLSFGVLETAQALGDRQALRDAGRVVVRVDLGRRPVEGLRRLAAAAAG
ncbi:MAG: glucose-6-phosphate isomerase [Gemmatimonadetes bacterium]|nr:glucose-6-phosphate isomerase [Gemmatimonadota bacterium]